MTHAFDTGFVLNNGTTATNGWHDYCTLWRSIDTCRAIEPNPEKIIRYNQRTSIKEKNAGFFLVEIGEKKRY